MSDLGDLAARSFPSRQLPDERSMLTAWLEYHRGTLAWKCSGLTDAQLRVRPVAPSSLSLLGLLRHMTEVERAWFQRVLLGTDVPRLYSGATNPDGDFDDVDTADVAADVARFAAECAASRAAVDGAQSLDVIGAGLWRGEPVSLRWILVHMVEEYARHNGHADLIRELIDGAVGY